MSEYLDITGLTYFYNQLKNKFALKSDVGTPLKANTASGMADTDKVYVYTGSETGYTYGNWYYYDGSSWVSGGVYNSSAFETDDTLSTSGMAADAKVTGDEITNLRNGLIKFPIIDNEYVTKAGVIDPYTGWSRTDYIDVSSFNKLSIVTSATSGYNVFFNEAKEPLADSSFVIAPPVSNITIPDTAYYAMLSMRTAGFDGMSIVGKIDVVKSSLRDNFDTELKFSLINGWIDQTTGEIQDSSTWLWTGYLPLNNVSSISVYGRASGYNAFYDSDKSFLTYFTISTGTTNITIPANASYIAFSGQSAWMAELAITVTPTLMSSTNTKGVITWIPLIE